MSVSISIEQLKEIIGKARVSKNELARELLWHQHSDVIPEMLVMLFDLAFPRAGYLSVGYEKGK